MNLSFPAPAAMLLRLGLRSACVSGPREVRLAGLHSSRLVTEVDHCSPPDFEGIKQSADGLRETFEAAFKKTYGSAFKQSVASLSERREETSCGQLAATAPVRLKRHWSPQDMCQVEH